MSYRQPATGKLCQRLPTAQRDIAQFCRLFLYIFRQHASQDTLRALQYGALRGGFELYPWAKPDDYIPSAQTASRQQNRRVSQVRQDSFLPYRQ